MPAQCTSRYGTLQADLDRLQEWEAEWLMEFNPSKCEVITLTKKTKPIVNNYTLHNTSLVAVDTAKYLGLNISSNYSLGITMWTVSPNAHPRP